MLNKSASYLSDYKFQLESDIFDEIPFASTKVLPKASSWSHSIRLCYSVSFSFVDGNFNLEFQNETIQLINIHDGSYFFMIIVYGLIYVGSL